MALVLPREPCGPPASGFPSRSPTADRATIFSKQLPLFPSSSVQLRNPKLELSLELFSPGFTPTRCFSPTWLRPSPLQQELPELTEAVHAGYPAST
ncbi:hypothetical protein CkaCkLH20_09492 [Colletotrichum karsti]|uniref:Uncharacterized protein n=1 Tax=Colletotrichum karsti TaxID=1095194 RepID=A0A9P6HXD5_9PEZI|nr:uncharacterized protein CkaCkLH20_09492 [Colletotrichum karsti]KAF9872982.1 hypothetical protein CkaCkLH20_09492 [Colletotrichum karsti]